LQAVRLDVVDIEERFLPTRSEPPVDSLGMTTVSLNDETFLRLFSGVQRIVDQTGEEAAS